jgi:hypothetical protein
MSRASWRFAAELHAQVGAVESGALEVGAGKDCTPEVCAGELCALEVDSGEVERSKAVGGKLAAPKHRHRSLHVSGRALWLRHLIVRVCPTAHSPAHRSASKYWVRSPMLPSRTGSAGRASRRPRCRRGRSWSKVWSGAGRTGGRRAAGGLGERPIAAGALERVDLQVRLLVAGGWGRRQAGGPCLGPPAHCQHESRRRLKEAAADSDHREIAIRTQARRLNAPMRRGGHPRVGIDWH